MDGESSVKKAYEAILNGDFEEAVVRFEEAIALEPDNADTYYRCSITCARSGKWSKALHYASQAVELEPEQEEYSYHLQTVRSRQLVVEAEMLLAQKPEEQEQALAMLREAVRLDPLSMEALLMLGAAYASLNRFEEAAEPARAAVRLDPGHSAARRLLSDIGRRRSALRTGYKRRKRKRNR